MTTLVEMGAYGVTFATNQRAGALVAEMPNGELTIDFTGVKTASPSFLNGLMAALSVRSASVTLTGFTPELERLAIRIIERRGETDRFKLLAAA